VSPGFHAGAFNCMLVSHRLCSSSSLNVGISTPVPTGPDGRQEDWRDFSRTFRARVGSLSPACYI
jgi:hypothetical protein